MKRKAAEKPASGDSTRQSKRSKMSSDQSHSYAGSCHCGETKFTVTVAPITKATACNCSLCSKQATLFIYPPSKAINFQKQDSLIEYRFGKKSLGHHFCGQCGCKVAVSRGKARPEWRAINVRLISELKPWTLEVGKYETRYMKALTGQASRKPLYVEPEFAGTEFESKEDDQEVQHGSCHCGDVTFALRTKPLPELEVTESNDSFEWRKGLLNLAINEDDLHLDEEDKLTTYKAGDGLETYHCKQCGVQTHQKDAEGALQLNLRAMNGLNVDKLKVTKQNKSSEG